jgi:hypothetical protein
MRSRNISGVDGCTLGDHGYPTEQEDLDMAEAASKGPPGRTIPISRTTLPRPIAMTENRIAWQKRIIDELAQARQETDCAVSMLHALEMCLHAFEQDRETTFDRCKM